jgi:hypothetical protein
VGKDPAAKAAEAKAPESKAPASGGNALSAKVNYVITLNGKEHRVTVAPQK